jgi:hypothetical protein
MLVIINIQQASRAILDTPREGPQESDTCSLRVVWVRWILSHRSSHRYMRLGQHHTRWKLKKVMTKVWSDEGKKLYEP